MIAAMKRRKRNAARTRRPVHEIGVAHELRERRLKLNIVARDLADRIGVSSISLSRWECGRVDPTSDNLRAWANALELELRFLPKRDTSPPGAASRALASMRKAISEIEALQ